MDSLILSSIFSSIYLEDLRLSDGFEISLFAQNIENVRQLAIGNNGTIFTGSRNAGNVYTLVDFDNDEVSDRKYLIDNNLSYNV